MKTFSIGYSLSIARRFACLIARVLLFQGKKEKTVKKETSGVSSLYHEFLLVLRNGGSLKELSSVAGRLLFE